MHQFKKIINFRLKPAVSFIDDYAKMLNNFYNMSKSACKALFSCYSGRKIQKLRQFTLYHTNTE